MVLATFIENGTSTLLENVLINACSTNVFPLVQLGSKRMISGLSNVTVRLYNVLTTTTWNGQNARIISVGCRHSHQHCSPQRRLVFDDEEQYHRQQQRSDCR
jgi:hypothetical protein